MFKIYPIKYLASLLNISEKDFHRNLKPVIVADFRIELEDKGIRNPDIGLDNQNIVYLVDPSDITNFVFTKLDINIYI